MQDRGVERQGVIGLTVTLSMKYGKGYSIPRQDNAPLSAASDRTSRCDWLEGCILKKDPINVSKILKWRVKEPTRAPPYRSPCQSTTVVGKGINIPINNGEMTIDVLLHGNLIKSVRR